jgi:hypothetical protein
MTEENINDGDARGSQIHTVRISFEDLKYVLKQRNQEHKSDIAVLRILPGWGFDDVETATIDWQDPNVFYPDGKVHIDINPRLLYGAESHWKVPGLAQYPDWHEERVLCREHHGLDVDEDMGDLWDEWWDRCLEVWEGNLKLALRDEVDLHGDSHGPNVQSVTVEIEWTDLD